MIRKWLLKYAPTFCWCRAADYYAMCENDLPDLDYVTLTTVLHQMEKRGEMKSKILTDTAAWGDNPVGCPYRAPKRNVTKAYLLIGEVKIVPMKRGPRRKREWMGVDIKLLQV